jgi:hypothetical protein
VPRERAIERVLRAVSDGAGDRLDRFTAVPQSTRSDVHAPPGEVGERRLPDFFREPPGERRARDMGQRCELLDRPGAPGLGMDRGHDVRQCGVAQRPQP